MDTEYNQYEVEAENMGDALNYLEDGMPVEVVFYDGKAISVELKSPRRQRRARSRDRHHLDRARRQGRHSGFGQGAAQSSLSGQARRRPPGRRLGHAEGPLRRRACRWTPTPAAWPSPTPNSCCAARRAASASSSSCSSPTSSSRPMASRTPSWCSAARAFAARKRRRRAGRGRPRPAATRWPSGAPARWPATPTTTRRRAPSAASWRSTARARSRATCSSSAPAAAPASCRRPTAAPRSRRRQRRPGDRAADGGSGQPLRHAGAVVQVPLLRAAQDAFHDAGQGAGGLPGRLRHAGRAVRGDHAGADRKAKQVPIVLFGSDYWKR
jgi:hypothetical protein